MSHLKIQKVPKSWPISRKSTKYVVRPNFNFHKGIPILVVLRDILKLCQTRREVKQLINKKELKLNNKEVLDEKNSMSLFDVLSINSLKKSYLLDLSEKGKFNLKAIEKSKSNKKISKIINKKTLKGKKTQLNLSGGINLLSEIKCNVNDSVLIDFENNKIEKCLPFKEKAKAIVLIGKHAGIIGEINKIDSNKKRIELKNGEEHINVLLKQLMVVE